MQGTREEILKMINDVIDEEIMGAFEELLSAVEEEKRERCPEKNDGHWNKDGPGEGWIRVNSTTSTEPSVDTPVLYTFQKMLDRIKEGDCIAYRKGWNGKDQYIFYTPGKTIRVEDWKGDGPKPKPKNGYYVILPHIDMITSQGDYLTGWLASQTDLLSNDWVVEQR